MSVKTFGALYSGIPVLRILRRLTVNKTRRKRAGLVENTEMTALLIGAPPFVVMYYRA